MKAVIITQPGGPEVLQLADRPVSNLRPGEVLIKVAAAGINRPDVAQRKGHYPPPPNAPQDIPGLEIAGTIEAVGDDVERWKIGEQVCALVSGGGYAQYCTAPAVQCLPIPAGLSLIEAASLPETFFTVWSNVFDRAKLHPGESILIHGGSSGIGVTAIQMAKALGSKVYVTAKSAEKCRFCEELGADLAIDYREQNFADEIAKATDGKGIDVILDMIGGDYTPLNLKSLADDGRLVLINTMKGKDVQLDLSLIMRKRLTITGSTLRNRDAAFKSVIAQNLEQHVWPLISSGIIKPVIYSVFDAADVRKAHQLMESSEHIGKIVLKF
ncbi:NAD(P)H-quinone oxidoreductase [Mucilaginibacter myungsuensis]|uniref:NAD(P)H-quinone oxidoreductase n=1 Tax=Mucilaginibacter myungsuensis TaxID=649104 RepID=A0A929PW80_9SPHI|nr:NAD(P)H-quinone oxidoreductase [Mucilaginibacter myungsuensis]MBE9660892.1 NAD(P)H-quinone oxidoreductase [Mucilaginibacter myungsuensis]MDN3600939.1 NAD(P)H-quinone oxidoreductase [Mucilaginibacter myungsuensis]